MNIENCTPGTQVMIVDVSLNCGCPADISIPVSNPNTPFGKLAIVVAVQDLETHPGKWIALCLKDPHQGAHACDGLVPTGHGWWSRPEYLYTPADREAHEEATQDWRDQQAAAQIIIDQFLSEGG